MGILRLLCVGSFQKLQLEASKILCHVFRDNTIQTVYLNDIVKGDFIVLQPGDKIPADGRLIAGSLQVNQMALSGEPEPFRKEIAPKDYVPVNPQTSDPYYLFRGSVIEEGEGVMIAEVVGMKTLYGKLAAEYNERDERKSPLQVKLNKLADGIATLGYIGAVLIAISFLFKQFVIDQNYSLTNLMNYITHWHLALKDLVTSVILAIIVIVVAVPEGLPMMIAIVLSLNMRKLLKSKVLVRKLLGIETAGSLTVLFTDKTGTLTKGQLEAHNFVSAEVKRYSSYREIPIPLRKLLSFCLKYSTSSIIGPNGVVVGGNASERAFLSFIDKNDLLQVADVKIEDEILFTSLRKYSASRLLVHENSVKHLPPIDGYHGGDLRITVVKGAPEIILPKCERYYNENGNIKNFETQHAIEAEIHHLSRNGIRVVAVATSREPLSQNPTKSLPPTLALVGILGVRDEVRPETRDALKLAAQAGIHVVMITGDRKETAIAVAREVELLPPVDESKSADEQDNDLPLYSVLTSTELHQMSDEELSTHLHRIRVIARALPTDKSRLVRIAQSQNEVVGMTGDGVNDSSALKRADVGFAMGSGTEVAKEASDVVILDDNFFSITQAVLYGRTIFKSIRKFIVFQSTINVACSLIVFLGPFMGYDFPLTIIQLLWVNLVMDTLAALAFGGEPALPQYMKEEPVKRSEAIVSPEMWSSILINAAFIASLCVVVLTWDPIADFFQRNGQPSESAFLTAFFSFFIFINIVNAFNVRTPRINIFSHLSENPGFLAVMALIFVVQITFTYIGGSVLRTVPLTLNEWILVISLSFVIVPFDILRKLIISPLLPKQFTDTSWKENIKDDALAKATRQSNNNNRTEITIPNGINTENSSNVVVTGKRKVTGEDIEVGEKKDV
jgi:Ca2+-transporting ATPase